MLSVLRAAWLPAVTLGLIALWIYLERPPEHEPGKVTLRWVINSQERDVQFAEAAKRAFEAKHPGIRIQFIKSNEGRKVDTMIAGGDAPDIVNVGMDRVHYFVRAGVLRDLTPFMSPEDRLDLSAFFPVALAPFTRLVESHRQLSTLNPQLSTRPLPPSKCLLPLGGHWTMVRFPCIRRALPRSGCPHKTRPLSCPPRLSARKAFPMSRFT